MGIEDRVERVLKKLKLNQFYPFPFARSGYWQTVYGTYWPILKAAKPDCFHHVTLPDGDVLVVAENRPKEWQPGGRIMLIVHGLAGCYESPYMHRMCRRMNKKGYLVLRLNLRFCGPGRWLARRPYHCGVSDDTRTVVEWAARQFPNSPLTQIGFSLGGNLTLKMAGEAGSKGIGNLDSAVSVSAPLDIESVAHRFNRPENKFFERVFLKYLLADLDQMRKVSPNIPHLALDNDLTIAKFDETLIPSMHGFKDVKEYYRHSSSVNYVPDIKIPTLILNSMDDPIADGNVAANLPPRDNIDVVITKHGGHVGFLGFGTSYDEVRWSDQLVARWLEDTMAI